MFRWFAEMLFGDHTSYNVVIRFRRPRVNGEMQPIETVTVNYIELPAKISSLEAQQCVIINTKKQGVN